MWIFFYREVIIFGIKEGIGMTSKNIPVIILNEVLLFPSVDLRLDFDSTYIKEIINVKIRLYS